MSKQDHYYDTWRKYIAGDITADDWMAYCTEVLAEILCQPEVTEVMVRLKHRE